MMVTSGIFRLSFASCCVYISIGVRRVEQGGSTVQLPASRWDREHFVKRGDECSKRVGRNFTGRVD